MYWKPVVFLGGLLTHLATAQQYAGDVITNSLPSVPGSEIAYFKIKEPTGKTPKAYNLTLINYQNLQSNGDQIVPSEIQRAVIIIHGLQRDPSTYMSNILSAIADVSDSNINPDSVAMMAPYFPNGDDKNYGYPYSSTNPTTNKTLVGSSQSYTGALVWTGSQWSGGGVNQYPAAYKTVSTYYVLDQLLQWFGNTTVFPNVKEIVVAGHSLGGQTVQRYVAAGLLPSQLGLTIPVTYWIANPNSYVWLNSSRPLSTSSCSDYDQWRNGLQNFTGYISPATYNTAVMGTTSVGNVATIQSNYYAKNKAYARGLLDTGDDSDGCEPEVSGANRNERFFAFIDWFPPTCKAPLSTTGHCDTVDFMEIGHDAGAMMASTAGQARLFTDNFYGNGSRAYDFGYPRVQAGDDPYPNPSLATNSTANETAYAGNMTLQGCYSDDSGTSTLSYLAYDNSSNTIELCTTTCYNAGYAIAGVEYGSQCYCADELYGGATYLVESACSEVCAGNANETCGDYERINIYSDGTPVSYAAPGNPESVDDSNYFYLNCYKDSVSSRTLSAKSYTDTANMTLENCAAYCSGYDYFGIEYAEECYCGGCFNGGGTILSQSDCEMTCTGDPSEYCGAGNALSVYQLSSSSNLTVISQKCSTATTTATTATTATSTASSIPTSSLCPAADGQSIIDANNNTYTVYCSSDSTQGAYTSASAVTSYLDCMTACDAQSSADCNGFTYVGGVDGSGSGTCWLKTAMGTYTSTGDNYIAAVYVSGRSTSTSTSATSSTSTASSSSSSSSSSAASLCPAADGQNIVDANNNIYTVACSSDSTQSAYTSASAADTYLDCMTACDAQSSSNGCTGFTYVGAVNGAGSGTCWLKTAMGTYTSTGDNYIAAVLVSTASSSSTAVSSSSTATGSATSTSSATTATATSTAVSCPASNGTTYTTGGSQFLIECGIDHDGGDMGSVTANTFAACINACATTSGCVDVSYLGTSCYMKSTLEASSTSASILGAKLISSSLSSSSSSSSTTVSSSTSSAATSTAVSCPASNGTTYTTSGAQFLIECGIDHDGGDMGSVTANTFAACINACATTSGCVDVSYLGTSCYMKSTLEASSTSASILGAKLISSSSSSSSSLSSSSSSSGTVASSSTSSAATSTAVSCPASNGTTYTTSGAQFLIECGIDHDGGDMGSVTADTFAACISACATTSGCLDVSYLGTSCYMKSTLMAAGTSADVYGAKLISSGTSSSSSSSSGVVASSSTSTVSVAVNVVSATSSTASSSSTTKASSTTSAFSSATATTCPGMNESSLVDSNGAVYNIYCSADTGSTTLNTISTSTGILGCMDGCDTQSGCTAFTYAASDSTMTGGFCYLRTVSSLSSAGSTVAVAVQVSPPGSVVISSSSSSSSSVASSSTVSSTSGTVASSSSSSTITSSTKSSSTTASTSTVQSSSSTVSAFSSATATVCPGMDQSSLIDSNGSVYNVYCSADTGNAVLAVTSTSTGILGCMVSCDATTGCTSFTYAGDSTMTTGFCYLRTIGSRSSAGSTTAVAVLVSTGSGSSSSSSSSSVASSSSSSSVSSSSSSSSVTSSSSSSSVSSSGTSAAAVRANAVSQSSSITSSSTSSSSSVSSSTVSASSASSSSSSSIGPSTTSSSSTASSTPSPSVTSTSTSSTGYSTSSSSSSTSSVTPFAPASIGNYTWLGCYNDTSSDGALQQAGFNSSTSDPMTLEKCASYCASYTYWGVENGQECLCGNVLDNAAYNTTASSCSTVCSGNSTELCGASGKLELYSLISSSTTSGVAQATGTTQRRRRGIEGMRGS